MKVLLANSTFGGGGITTFATQLVACLSADTELTVVIGDDSKSPIMDKRVKVIYKDTENLSLSNALSFIDLINNKINPDVVIISAATVVSSIIPYLNNTIKILTVSHSGKFFHSDYCAVNHKYIDNIIAASSEFNKHYLERKFNIKKKDKVRVVYNFVNNDDELENLRHLKPSQHPIRIVYAGAVSVHKSPDLVAKIVLELLKTDLEFVFYWTGKTDIPLTKSIFKKSKIKSIQQLFPSDSRLIFPGRIDSKRAYDKLLGGANVFLAPSQNEGCSMALLEAHRSGCIIIVADYNNSNREIVLTGNSGFVINHKKVNVFFEKLSDIIKNPQDYFQFYENSHKTFENLLSYPVWRNEILNLLKERNNHKKRKKIVSKIGIWFSITKLKWLKTQGDALKFLKLSLPTFISIQKLYYKSIIK